MKGTLAAVTSFGLYMGGAVSEATLVLLTMMILDFISGLLRAWFTKTINSTLGLAGVIKKIAILVLLAMSAAIEFFLIHTGQDTNGLLLLGVTSFFIVNEGISILENCAQIGLPIPPILYLALDKLNKDPEGKEAQLDRDPRLDQMDKEALKKENQQLMKELRKAKSPIESDPDETQKEGAI